MHKVYKIHEWMLYLDLGPILEILHYVYANIPKSEEKQIEI